MQVGSKSYTSQNQYIIKFMSELFFIPHLGDSIYQPSN